MLQLSLFNCNRNTQYTWVWSEEDGENYSMKYAYNVVLNFIMKQEIEVFKQLWSLKVKPSALHFSWKLLLEKVPTKENLEKRMVGLINTLCSLCQSEYEITNHLFVTCSVVQNIWDKCDRWVGVSLVRHKNIRCHFSKFYLTKLNFN